MRQQKKKKTNIKSGSELKLLTIPLQIGLRKQTKELLNRRKITIQFSKHRNVDRIPRRELLKFDAFGIVTKLNHGLTIVVTKIPKKPKKKPGRT